MTTGLSQFEFKGPRSRVARDDEDGGGEEEEEEENEEEEANYYEMFSERDARKESWEYDAKLEDAKTYLSSSRSNLYDHMVNVLIAILDHRPTDVVDIFEDLSAEVKSVPILFPSKSLSDCPELITESALAQIQKKIFKVPDVEGDMADDEEGQPMIENLVENGYYLEQANVGINKEELFKVFLAMRHLIADESLVGARFWGKIFGLEQNYIVVEASGGKEEDEEGEVEEQENAEDEEEEEEEDETNIPLPKITYKPPPETPTEEPWTGTNSKIYYVCNDPGKLWTKLPPVTPKQVRTAQKIMKFFTGRLDAPIICFPPFPGTEINFLRAQIARISSATHISPVGYYTMGEEEEEEEATSEMSVNPDYVPPSMRELYRMSLNGWVHHVEYILPQGRCKWWNPVSEEEGEDEEEEEEEELKEPKKKVVPQIGPPLLTPLSEDERIHGLAPWTVELSSLISPDEGVVAVHSNLWNGAHALFTGLNYINIYVGWGIKTSTSGYNPSVPTFLSSEFPHGPDLVEIDDPVEEPELEEEEEEEEDEEDEDTREAEGDDAEDD